MATNLAPVFDTCQLNEANPFDYLTQLQRHGDQLAASPLHWMSRNYHEALQEC